MLSNHQNNDSKLINSIFELDKQVETAVANFEQLDKVLKSFKLNSQVNDPKKIGEYEFKTYTGAFLVNTFFKRYALDIQTYTFFAERVTEWNALAFLLSPIVTLPIEKLKKTPNFENAKSVITNISQANRPNTDINILAGYIRSFEKVFNFVNGWAKLDVNVRNVLYAHCKEKFNFTQTHVDSLFNYPFKHITSLNSHLTTMSHIFSSYSNDNELNEIAVRFNETNKLITEYIKEFSGFKTNSIK